MSWRHPIRKRLLHALLALWMVVLMSGAPLPALSQLASLAGVSLSGNLSADAERFPCEACACGCATAEYCWKNCCCHTISQRVAWAQRNNVRPPDSALQEAAFYGIDVSEWGVKPLSQSSVAFRVPKKPKEKALPPCCAARLRKAQQAGAQQANGKQAVCKQDISQPGADVSTKSPAQGVSLIKALACQGLLKQWLTIGTAPLPPMVAWTPCFDLLPADTEPAILYTSWASAPVLPPPEC